MLRRPSQIWRSCKNSVFSCKVLLTYIVTSFLFVKIFFSVPCIDYKLMKLFLKIFSVLSQSSWWQQSFRKTYSLRCQIGVMISDSFAFRETKNCRQHPLLVLRSLDVGDLSAYVTEWRGANCEWSTLIYNRTLHESWDRTDFTTLKLLLATEPRASLTFLGGRVEDS